MGVAVNSMRIFNKRSLRGMLIGLCALGLTAGLLSSHAFSIWDLFGDDEEQQPTVVAAAAPAAPAAVAEPVRAEPPNYGDVEKLLSALNLQERGALLADADKFKQFIDNETNLRSVLAAAEVNRLHENAAMRVLMERAAQRVLAEAYLNQLVRTNMKAGFPTDADIRQYYDQNSASFEIPQRVHLWQIYWAAQADANAAALAKTKKTAQSVQQQLRAGKRNFGSAAAEFSEHQASRGNGGYMGLIKVVDLLPEVRTAVKSLKENAISDLIATDTGFHVVKRGAMVAPQTVSFEQAAAQIRKLMLRQGTAQVREAIITKTRETYPAAVDAAEVERWYAKLKAAAANQSSAATTTN